MSLVLVALLVTSSLLLLPLSRVSSVAGERSLAPRTCVYEAVKCRWRWGPGAGCYIGRAPLSLLFLLCCVKENFCFLTCFVELISAEIG